MNSGDDSTIRALLSLSPRAHDFIARDPKSHILKARALGLFNLLIDEFAPGKQIYSTNPGQSLTTDAEFYDWFKSVFMTDNPTWMLLELPGVSDFDYTALPTGERQRVIASFAQTDVNSARRTVGAYVFMANAFGREARDTFMQQLAGWQRSYTTTLPEEPNIKFTDPAIAALDINGAFADPETRERYDLLAGLHSGYSIRPAELMLQLGADPRLDIDGTPLGAHLLLGATGFYGDTPPLSTFVESHPDFRDAIAGHEVDMFRSYALLRLMIGGRYVQYREEGSADPDPSSTCLEELRCGANIQNPKCTSVIAEFVDAAIDESLLADHDPRKAEAKGRLVASRRALISCPYFDLDRAWQMGIYGASEEKTRQTENCAQAVKGVLSGDVDEAWVEGKFTDSPAKTQLLCWLASLTHDDDSLARRLSRQLGAEGFSRYLANDTLIGKGLASDIKDALSDGEYAQLCTALSEQNFGAFLNEIVGGRTVVMRALCPSVLLTLAHTGFSLNEGELTSADRRELTETALASGAPPRIRRYLFTDVDLSFEPEDAEWLLDKTDFLAEVDPEHGFPRGLSVALGFLFDGAKDQATELLTGNPDWAAPLPDGHDPIAWALSQNVPAAILSRIVPFIHETTGHNYSHHLASLHARARADRAAEATAASDPADAFRVVDWGDATAAAAFDSFALAVPLKGLHGKSHDEAVAAAAREAELRELRRMGADAAGSFFNLGF